MNQFLNKLLYTCTGIIVWELPSSIFCSQSYMHAFMILFNTANLSFTEDAPIYVLTENV